MRKKRLTIILIIFSILVLFIVFSSTIFILKSVDIRFLNAINILSGKDEQIIESGEFNYNENVMLLNKKKYIDNLEKNNPYLKVVNLEVKFPNSLTINCVERKSLFCIKNLEEYYLLDEDFKVLEVVSTFETGLSNEILLENISINQNYMAGEFVSFDETLKLKINSLLIGLKEWKSDNDNLKFYIKSITLNYETTEKIMLSMNNEKRIIIKDYCYLSSDKFNIAFSTFLNYISNEKNNIYVYNNKEGEIKCVVS